MICLVKRALPFAMTLIVGTGLGSIFGFGSKPEQTRKSWTNADIIVERRSSCRSSERRRHFRDSTPLNIRFQPNTSYTPEALKNKTTGVVKLLVRFNEDRTATVVEQLSTLPDGLTQEAVRVAERTQFDPETVNGQPVAVTKEMNYIFSLSDRVTMEMDR